MNIIDRWCEMTKCKDCCKGHRFSMYNDGYWQHSCGALPGTQIVYTMPHCRCDSGLWLFRGKTPGVIGGPYAIPFDLKDWLEIKVGINPDTYTLIPREDWPEVEE